MKSGWLILIGVLLFSATGYLSSHWLAGSRASEECAACNMAAPKTTDALAWMQRDYALSDDEFVKVCDLHDAYLPKCDAMCQQMAAATARLTEALKVNPTMNDEAQAALRDYEAARAGCQRDTLQHVLDTAAVMKPQAGRAFVQKVLPHLFTSRQHVRELHP